MNIEIRSLAPHDLPEADRIFRLAFGTFLGLPEPLGFMGDADLVGTRWRAAPAASLGAYVDGNMLVGSNLMANWGSHVDRGACPGVVFNAMVAETGEPMLFSTALLPASLARFAFERHYPRLDVRLATAARLSAAFPYVSPATHAQHDTDPRTTIPAGDSRRSGYRHVVDGGYFDNFGVATAAEWLNAELLALEQANKLPPRVLLIEICEEPSCSSTMPTGDLAPGGPRRSLPYQLFAPVSALYQMRGAAQRSRNRWHVALLRQRWAPRVDIQSVLFPYPLEAGPMSWHLSETEKGEILRSWNESPIKAARQAVGAFLDAAGAPAGSQP